MKSLLRIGVMLGLAFSLLLTVGCFQATTPISPSDITPTELSASSDTADSIHPSALTKYLEDNGYSYQDLAVYDCKQLVVVAGKGYEATIHLYENTQGKWRENKALACSGFVGKNGLAHNKYEGDKCTPIGLYKIGSAFHFSNAPLSTKLHCLPITNNSYWVDDPDSSFYNQYVTQTDGKDWNSAEHMMDYDGYEYGFVINYNEEGQKNAGSAIFFHIGNSYTAGCIATDKAMVLSYLSVLDPNQNPYILITPRNE